MAIGLKYYPKRTVKLLHKQMNYFNYKRRNTVDVPIGNIVLGGNHPIAVQTMTNTNTLHTDASVAQCERIIAAGAKLIRLTAQGVREAENL